MGVLMTEHEFTLPLGYADSEGNLHKKGVMRLATAGDEILPMKDPRVQQNPAYLSIILLSRVVIKLGDMPSITPKTIEGLFTADLNFLQDMYNRINQNGRNAIQTVCPKCDHSFDIEAEFSGEY
jgi:hypothetical protein